MDGGGRQLARRHDLFNLYHRNAPGGGHQRVKVLRRMAIDHVAVPVGFPALNQGEIAANRLFEDVVFARELADFFAFRHRRAVAGGGIKPGNAGAPGTYFFRQRPLWGEVHLQFTAEHLLFKQRVFTDVRRHHFAYLAGFQQQAETKAINAAVIRYHRQPAHPAAFDFGNQVLRDTTQAKAAGQQRHSIR